MGAEPQGPVSHLSIDDLRALAAQAKAGGCPLCAPLKGAGWDSLPSTFDTAALQRGGTLRRDGDEDLTLQEHHPNGTHGWSAEAPIAPAFFPYNRCDVWACRTCSRAFLRYTEYGGYYEDARIRRLDPGLLDDAQP